MKPLSMPTASLSTLATGARQLVVHEALETTVCALVELVVVDAIDDGEVDAVGRRRDQDALGAGGRCAEALSFEVKMPVHSSAMSMPSSRHGNCAGSFTAVTLMAPLPQLMVSPLTVTVPGKRPWMES